MPEYKDSNGVIHYIPHHWESESKNASAFPNYKECQTKNLCQNGGKCYVNTTTGKEECLCALHTTGKHCEKSHVFTVCSRPQDKDYCLNGGTCIVDNFTGERSCLCSAEYGSDRCQLFVVSPPRTGSMSEVNASNIRLYTIIGIIIGCCALVGVAILAIVRGRQSKKRAGRKTRRESSTKESDLEAAYSETGSKNSRLIKPDHVEIEMVDLSSAPPALSRGMSTQTTESTQTNEKELNESAYFYMAATSRKERMDRQSAPVFRALPEGYNGSFHEDSRRERLKATRGGPSEKTEDPSRRSSDPSAPRASSPSHQRQGSVDAALLNGARTPGRSKRRSDFSNTPLSSLDAPLVSDHLSDDVIGSSVEELVMKRLQRPKSAGSRRNGRVRSPTISDVPLRSLTRSAERREPEATDALLPHGPLPSPPLRD